MWQACKKIKIKLKVAHRWTLACTCVFCLFLCVFLHRKGRRTAGRRFTGLRRRTRPLGYTGSHVAGKGKKTGTKQNKKQLEMSQLVRSTFGASPPAGVQWKNKTKARPGLPSQKATKYVKEKKKELFSLPLKENCKVLAVEEQVVFF